MVKTHDELSEAYLYMELNVRHKISDKTLLEKIGIDYDEEIKRKNKQPCKEKIDTEELKKKLKNIIDQINTMLDE